MAEKVKFIDRLLKKFDLFRRSEIVDALNEQYENSEYEYEQGGKNRFHNGGMFAVIRIAHDLGLWEFEHRTP